MNTKERLKYKKKVLYNKNADAFLKKHTPKTVFKYRAGVSNNSDGELYDIDALLNQYLWEPNAVNLNDPYDCAIRLEYDYYAIKKIVNDENLINATDKEILQDRMNTFGEEWRKHWHIISFSERIDSILMWSHYANEHKGFCIEYNTNEFMSTLFPVIYSDVFDNVLENIDAAQTAVLTKAKDWKYEREWRIVNQTIDDVELGGFMYPSPKPIAIYMGCRIDTNAELREKLTDYARRENVKLYKMQLRRDSYILEAVEMKIKKP